MPEPTKKKNTYPKRAIKWSAITPAAVHESHLDVRWAIVAALVQVPEVAPLGHNPVQLVVQVQGHIWAGVLVKGQGGTGVLEEQVAQALREGGEGRGDARRGRVAKKFGAGRWGAVLRGGSAIRANQQSNQALAWAESNLLLGTVGSHCTRPHKRTTHPTLGKLSIKRQEPHHFHLCQLR